MGPMAPERRQAAGGKQTQARAKAVRTSKKREAEEPSLRCHRISQDMYIYVYIYIFIYI